MKKVNAPDNSKLATYIRGLEWQQKRYTETSIDLKNIKKGIKSFKKRIKQLKKEKEKNNVWYI